MQTVACIIPCYNYGKYLKGAIDSVLAQSRVPDEIILVDDCSTDDSAQIAQGYPQITYVKHICNRGLAAARNTGIYLAKSTYVFSFDADDILRPQGVEKHLELAGENTVVTLPLMAFGSETYTAYPEKGCLDIFLRRNCIYSNSLYPKALWEKIGGFDESETMRLGLEDWEAWIRMAKAGAQFVTGTYVALLWRRHPHAMSTASANPNWATLMQYFRGKHIDFKG